MNAMYLSLKNFSETFDSDKEQTFLAKDLYTVVNKINQHRSTGGQLIIFECLAGRIAINIRDITAIGYCKDRYLMETVDNITDELIREYGGPSKWFG